MIHMVAQDPHAREHIRVTSPRRHNAEIHRETNLTKRLR